MHRFDNAHLIGTSTRELMLGCGGVMTDWPLVVMHLGLAGVCPLVLYYVTFWFFSLVAVFSHDSARQRRALRLVEVLRKRPPSDPIP
jgi:hypothetical protein